MTVCQVCAVALSASALLTLHGCGGGGDEHGPADGGSPDPHAVTPQPDTITTSIPTATTMPTAATTTSTTTSTTFTTGIRTPPLNGEDAAAYFNSFYTGYKLRDESSPVGVVMRTADTWGFFCPGFQAYQGCYQGFSKCITSASILNNRVMINNGDQLYMGLERNTGIMFNTSLIESKLGRCTYQFDGTSWGRYNRGCGSTSPILGPGTCQTKGSAWSNICDVDTDTQCTDTDSLVLKDYCPERVKNGDPPRTKNDPPCFWKGPAFSTGDGFIKSETHKMLAQRITNQGQNSGEMATWDEVVIDAELLLQELWRDPAQVIPAFVYKKTIDAGETAGAKRRAEKMAVDMQAEFHMLGPVPVVGIDSLLQQSQQPNVPGPFFYGKPWTTETTTTTPRTQTACCWGDCMSSCAGVNDYCSSTTDNCESSCAGIWCPPPLAGTPMVLRNETLLV